LVEEADAATEELTRNTETDPSAPNNEWF